MGKRTLNLVSLLLVIGFLASPLNSKAQVSRSERVRKMIETYKAEIRGPYRDIRWFCKDGSIKDPKDPCGEIEGVQRARYREEVINLGEKEHIYLGQILATTFEADFWDAGNNHSRAKQYQLEKFLFQADNGWIQRKSQFYRGAMQIEDEQEWGRSFLRNMLSKDQSLEQNFFLHRQMVGTIPHAEDNDQSMRIRAVSKEIADLFPAFMDLRIKIHGQPESVDLEAVIAFKIQHQSKLSSSLNTKFETLIADMKAYYKPIDLSSLNREILTLPYDSKLRAELTAFITNTSIKSGSPRFAAETVELLVMIRDQILSLKGGKARLAAMDLSLKLEKILLRELANWKTPDLATLLQKTFISAQSALGCGYLENWEWNRIREDIQPLQRQSIDLNTLICYQEASRKAIDWGSATARAVFGDVIKLYSEFEPLAGSFPDDVIRSSTLLYLGQCASALGDVTSREANLSNYVLQIPDQSRIRGINPGYALGELVIVSESPDEIEVESDKIYVFLHAPSDLKPVAGILTVSEGNIVSHVQLLARNLGIPNAGLSQGNLESLKKHNGKRVFYAVSNKGTVILKPEESMYPVEKKLFEVLKRDENKIAVPVDKIDLNNRQLLNLKDLRSTDSGKLCGPKAANLGQLKFMFPDKVVEGFVVPFGIFREHMDQPMPGKGKSYWEFLNATFATANEMRAKGQNEEEIEVFTLSELGVLREAIKKMRLKPEFEQALRSAFPQILGGTMGKVPVFLRSDTNMEDLKDFTGAGLNLTVFNVTDADKILQGIRDVWASPYAERSYKWRQKYLLNPENVYPSLLVIPSVDVDYSGVMITKGVTTGLDADITVAFSRGAGGAVDGQAAESWLLEQGGKDILISPAREAYFNSLPITGGLKKKIATFEKPVLSPQNLNDLRKMAGEIKAQLFKTGLGNPKDPWDIELGFKDGQIWLFQVRPFVENKKALASEYLRAISPKITGEKTIPLSTPI